MYQALRLGYQARDIYLKGDFTYPLDQSAYLIGVKQGLVSIDVARAELNRLIAEIEELSKLSALPEEPIGADVIDGIIAQAYVLARSENLL